MKTKTIGTLLIAGLILFSVTVVFAGTAAAYYQITFSGYINGTSGNGAQGVDVEITKELGLSGSGNWESVGVAKTDGNGYYNMISRKYYPVYPLWDGVVKGNYRLYLDDQLAEEVFIPWGDWEFEGSLCRRHWSYQWNSELIPEFATVAIPAIAVLGLFLFFNKRKHKND